MTGDWRRGVVLLMVLVVVVVLAMAAYAFTSRMLAERETVDAIGDRIQARLLAESGIEYVKCLARNRDAARSLRDEERFRHVAVRSPEGSMVGTFTILAPDEDAGIYGVTNLSARLNVNQLAECDDETARQALLRLPGMSYEVADAILDWIDADDEPREFGAENDYYAALNRPYACSNRPVRSLDELVLVRGVTRAVLYGSDRNRNGRIDPRETDHGATTGLSRWLTAVSSESNRRRDGRPRINVNDPELPELFDRLEREFGTDTARFVVAYRIYGPHPPRDDLPPVTPDNRAAPLWVDKLDAASASPIRLVRSTAVTQQRGGLILNAGPRFTVASVFDLIGVQVPQLSPSGRLIVSPWSADPDEMADYLPNLMDTLSTTDRSTIPGRINVLLAEEEILEGIPHLADSAAAIVVARQAIVRGERPTLAWLLAQNILPMETLRRVAPYLTTGGDVYAGQVIGQMPNSLPLWRVEYIVDASRPMPRLLCQRNVTNLGVGFGRDELAASTEAPP